LAGLLAQLAKDGVRLSEHMDGDGAVMFQHACAMGLEGVVSKRRTSSYRSGRCADWLKVKNPDSPAAKRIAEIEW
jgi:bifunctional non-homologous end joining protein LigD